MILSYLLSLSAGVRRGFRRKLQKVRFQRRNAVHMCTGPQERFFTPITNTHKRWIICCFRCTPIYGNGQSVCRPKDGVKTAPTCANNSSSSFWPMAKKQILENLNYNTKRMFKSQMEVNIFILFIGITWVVTPLVYWQLLEELEAEFSPLPHPLPPDGAMFTMTRLRPQGSVLLSHGHTNSRNRVL